jgi:hypothetical protein
LTRRLSPLAIFQHDRVDGRDKPAMTPEQSPVPGAKTWAKTWA